MGKFKNENHRKFSETNPHYSPDGKWIAYQKPKKVSNGIILLWFPIILMIPGFEFVVVGVDAWLFGDRINVLLLSGPPNNLLPFLNKIT